MKPLDKNRPGAHWLAALRRRFPTEREIDRILTRQLERRSGPGYRPVPLQTLIDGTRALIRSRHQGPVAIRDARWLSGGASKLQVAFTLEWQRPGTDAERTPMVLRMEPAESYPEPPMFDHQVLADSRLVLDTAHAGGHRLYPVAFCPAAG